MSAIGVVLSSGVGRRFNSDMPKQYHKINDKMVVGYVIEALKNCKKIDKIVVAVGNDYYAELIEKEFGIKAILGGETRNETVQNVLNYIRKENKYDKVLFLDAARPNIKSDYIDECVELLDSNDAVITTQKITDSLGSYENIDLDRAKYFLIQTPECFRLDVLNNFDVNSQTTAMVQQLNKSCKIYNNFNCPNNIKITYSGDLKMASEFLRE